MSFEISQNFLFSFPFLIFSLFECRTNSFIYSLVEQILETYFLKNNYRGKGYTFGRKKLAKIFGFIYPLTWSEGKNYTSNWWTKRTLLSQKLKLLPFAASLANPSLYLNESMNSSSLSVSSFPSFKFITEACS